MVLTDKGCLKPLCELPFIGMEEEVGSLSSRYFWVNLLLCVGRAGDGTESSQC